MPDDMLPKRAIPVPNSNLAPGGKQGDGVTSLWRNALCAHFPANSEHFWETL
jgi:hypothetical protein